MNTLTKDVILKYLTTILKYLFSFIFILLTYKTTGKLSYVGASLLELLLIFVIFNAFVEKHFAFQILHSIVMFFFNANILVLFFGSSFITLVMLQNLNSLEDLGGKVVPYSIGVVVTLIFTFLPIKQVSLPKLPNKMLIPVVALAEALILTITPVTGYSPLNGYYSLAVQYHDAKELAKMMEEAKQDLADITAAAETDTEDNEEAESTASTDDEIAEAETEEAGTNPVLEIEHSVYGSDVNVIVIFVEGLSKNIITDSRNIMPNVASFANQSISFNNYYNHTFATYRGLQGQLYSGYSLEDTEHNSNTALMDVLKSAGYYTAFLNTEPNNETFTAYLNDMSFDTVISNQPTYEVHGEAESLTDQEAFQTLFNTALSYENSGQKFFLAMYAFGTHASLDSKDVVYGDGSDRLLNKFYSSDYWFGSFLEQFKNSSLASNTVIVFTADHSTYADEDFNASFPEYHRNCSDCDEIPLYIYYQGKTMSVDAEGRNSLDMAPTLLDLLGLEKPDNFLGDSLFNEKGSGSVMDVYFFDPAYLATTSNDMVQFLSGDEKDTVKQQVSKYIASK